MRDYFSCMGERSDWRLCRVAAAVVAALGLIGGEPAWAVVTSSGNVTPSVNPGNPGGGNVTAPLFIGDTSVGIVAVATPAAQATPSIINVTTGSITVGDEGESIGQLQILDLGSVVSTNTTFDMIIGNAGVGKVDVLSRGRINVADDLSLGLVANSSGALVAQDLGTIIDIGDDVTVGAAAVGLVQLTLGARLFADTTIIGLSSGSNGRSTINGFQSLWRQTGAMTIGSAGVGALHIEAQGALETANAVIGDLATGVGTAAANGAGTSWKVTGSLAVGGFGKGTLEVTDGASLSNTGSARLATSAGSEARVKVSGVNALWNAGTLLTIGQSGFATFDVRSGARVVAGNTIIADNTGSRGEVIVEGRGSVLEIVGTLDVSDPGEADLTIANSGLVTTTGVARVAVGGRLSFVGGRLEVGGVGGLTNNGILSGSGRIVGAVTNTTNGRVRTQIGDRLSLTNTLNNLGVVELDSGELDVGGQLTNNGDMDLQAAIVRAGGIGLVNNANAQIAAIAGTIDVFGDVDNKVDAQVVVGGDATAVFHDVLTSAGQFFVFEGGKVIALENLSFMPSSALSVQLGLVDDEEEFGQVTSSGAAAVAGALAVTLAQGFSPTLGDSYEIVSAAGGVTGTFATTSLPMLAPGLTWDLDYAAASVLLTVVPGLTADFNGDGTVTSADLGLWKTGAGKATGALKTDGDADGDGDVDGNDFMAWQRQLGMGSVTGAVGAVPEPASAMLAAGCLALAAGWRRRHVHHRDRRVYQLPNPARSDGSRPPRFALIAIITAGAEREIRPADHCAAALWA